MQTNFTTLTPILAKIFKFLFKISKLIEKYRFFFVKNIMVTSCSRIKLINERFC